MGRGNLVGTYAGPLYSKLSCGDHAVWQRGSSVSTPAYECLNSSAARAANCSTQLAHAADVSIRRHGRVVANVNIKHRCTGGIASTVSDTPRAWNGALYPVN